jgi:VanZ like family
MSGRALAPGDPHYRLSFWLLVLCMVAITHGSLYPWTFREPWGGWLRGWHHLWGWWSRPLWTSTGDVVGNVLLFIPQGMLAWRVSMGWRCGLMARFVAVVVLSLVFAWALRVAQIWLPTRSAAISDVVWNALGLVIGFAVHRGAARPIAWLSQRLKSRNLLGYSVATFWLLLLWWPLLPLLDRRMLGSAWHRVRDVSGWEPVSALLACLALLVVLHLLRPLRGRLLVGFTLIVVAHLGSFFFVQKAGAVANVSSNTLGWGLALVLGFVSWQLDQPTANRVLLFAAILGALLSALSPFAWSAAPTQALLLPFASLFTEPRVAHSAAFLWQAFWVLALLIGAQRQGWHLPTAAVLLTLLVAAIEWLQRWIPGQQADVTPLLLPALCAWLLLRLAHRQQRLGLIV